jgi:5'(3')-deoxyribonucleotidase
MPTWSQSQRTIPSLGGSGPGDWPLFTFYFSGETMKLIKEIYLDMDDVLNTCGESIFELFGVGGEPFIPAYGYDIVGMVNYILFQRDNNHECISVSDFWSSIPGFFWGDIPKSKGCDALVEQCIQCVGAENVYVATTPTKCSDQMKYKHRWILENLPESLHRNFFLTPRKWQLGCPGALLIDDHAGNVHKFRARGGHGIIHPQPWNINTHYCPMNPEYTMSMLEDLTFGERP